MKTSSRKYFWKNTKITINKGFLLLVSYCEVKGNNFFCNQIRKVEQTNPY